MSLELLQELNKGLEGIQAKMDSKMEIVEKQISDEGEASKKLMADLSAMGKDFEGIKEQMNGLRDSMMLQAQNGMQIQQPAPVLSVGKQFIESDTFKAYQDGQSTRAKMEFQNNTIIGEGGSPQTPTNDIVPLQTMPGIVGGAFRQLRIKDIMPQGNATGNLVHYTRELLFTNNAAETAEAATKPESVLTFEGVDAPVRTIPHFIKVSKQVLDDAPMLASYIDTRLSYGVELRCETQIVNGDETGSNLGGILKSGNHTTLTAETGANDFDFANSIKYKVAESDYNADIYLINPQDWGRMERLKVGSGDARYVGADGAIGYLQNGLVPTLWGLPVIASNSVPAGKIICMSIMSSMFWNRQDPTVEIFEQDGDNVQKNLLTVRGEMRGAFTVFRPAAIVAGDLPDAS